MSCFKNQTFSFSGSSYELGRRYTGCISDWRGTFGFLTCVLIPERIFFHFTALNDGCYMQTLPADPTGVSINFELGYDKAKNGFRAYNAVAYL